MTNSSGDFESQKVDYSTSDSKGKTKCDLMQREDLGAESLFAEDYEQQTMHDNIIKSPIIQYKRRENFKQANSNSKEVVLGERNNGEKWDAVKTFLQEMNLALVPVSSKNENGRLGKLD